MPHNFARITAAGFLRAGGWLLKGDRLEYTLDASVRTLTNVLYAFVVDGALRYVGKTSLTINDRLQRYKTPTKGVLSGGSTNIKNNLNIWESLIAGLAVDIYVLVAPREESHSGFKLSFAAALEDSLISELRPLWNGSTRRTGPREPKATIAEEIEPKVPSPISSIPAEHFRRLLLQAFCEATDLSATHIDIQSGEFHRQVGVYPNKGHSMPTCCSVMRQAMREGDEILSEPPKGKGATLRIRYRLPHNAPSA